MSDYEHIESSVLLQLLKSHKQNLAELLLQEVNYTKSDRPIRLINQIRATKDDINAIELEINSRSTENDVEMRRNENTSFENNNKRVHIRSYKLFGIKIFEITSIILLFILYFYTSSLNNKEMSVREIGFDLFSSKSSDFVGDNSLLIIDNYRGDISITSRESGLLYSGVINHDNRQFYVNRGLYEISYYKNNLSQSYLLSINEKTLYRMDFSIYYDSSSYRTLKVSIYLVMAIINVYFLLRYILLSPFIPYLQKIGLSPKGYIRFTDSDNIIPGPEIDIGKMLRRKRKVNRLTIGFGREYDISLDLSHYQNETQYQDYLIITRKLFGPTVIQTRSGQSREFRESPGKFYFNENRIDFSANRLDD